MLRRVAPLLAALLAGPPPAAQQHVSAGEPGAGQLIERLMNGAEPARLIAEFRRAGPRATAALADATLTAVRDKRPQALRLAHALAQVGHADAALAQLLAAIPDSHGEVFDLLLHALGNALLLCTDAEQVARVEAAVDSWARQGRFYSPSADAPAFAWHEYVRLRRRLHLQCDGGDLPAARRALEVLREARSVVVRFAIGDPTDHKPHDLNAHGAHGQRETLEAVAELVLRFRSVDLVHELALYLEHEKPRPGVIVVEHCAGIGENAPVDLPGVRLPTRWHRDDWRFAVARAVFALHPDRTARERALRHLLHAPSPSERIEALVAVRQLPPPWTAFGPDLAACLGDGDRTVVREALVTLGLAGEAARPARAGLARLVAADDSELAAQARRVLERLQ